MNSMTRLTSLNYNNLTTIERLIIRGTQQELSQCTKTTVSGAILWQIFRDWVARLEADLA